MTLTLPQTVFEKLSEALNSGEFQRIQFILNSSLRPVEVARLLEKSPPKERQILWKLIQQDLEGDVLQHLSDDVQAEILRHMDASEVLAITESLDMDDMADVIQQLPDRVTKELLRIMDKQNRQRVETALSYPEDTAGGLMNTDSMTIRPDVSIDTALRYLRRHKDIPEMTDSLMVVSRKKGAYIGNLPLTKLLTADPNMTVREIMQTDIQPIPVTLSDREVTLLFEQNNLVSAPVVNTDNQLVGRITIDDVVDVIREDADHALMSMAGLGEEDTFAPLFKTTRRRAIWLGVNLMTAFIASAVIGLFEATLDQVVALAVLMPIVASMGGIAGSQTLTLMIRGQALGHVERSNTLWLLNREVLVSLMNGVLWSSVVALISIWWFQDTRIGIIIALALIITLLVGALAGTFLPIVLKKLGIDPAIAGNVLLTTLTDVVGFFTFLSLASLFYL